MTTIGNLALEDDDLGTTVVERSQDRARQDRDNAMLASLQRWSTLEELPALAAKAGLPLPESRRPNPLRDLATQKAAQHGVDPDLVHRVIQAESGWNPKATSPKGAAGLMQLMPGTARGLNVSDPYNPDQNVDGGVRYLRSLLDRYDNDTTRALVGYNWGPGRADKWDGNAASLPEETRLYVQKIMGRQPGSGSSAVIRKPIPKPHETDPETPNLFGDDLVSFPTERPEIDEPEAVSQFALGMLLQGKKPEEIEAELAGIREPLYGPPDMAQDILSGGLTAAGRLGASGVKGFGAAAKGVAQNVALGAASGGAMAAAEELGAGPILQTLAGVVGPAAAAALVQGGRAAVRTFLKRLPQDNPELFDELRRVVDDLGDSTVAREIKDVLELSRNKLSEEAGALTISKRGSVNYIESDLGPKVQQGFEIVMTYPQIQASTLFETKLPYDQAKSVGVDYYNDVLRKSRIEAPAFSGAEVFFEDKGLAHLLGEHGRTLSDEDVVRRLDLLPKAKAILESTPYVDSIRPKPTEGVTEYGLLGRFDDGSVVRVVVDEIEQDGKKFLTVFDWEDVSKKVKRTPSPSSASGAAGRGVGEAPSLDAKQTVSSASSAVNTHFENDPEALVKITSRQAYTEMDILSHETRVAPAEKYSININHERIQAPEDIHAAIEATARQLPDKIDEARRGVITQEQTRLLAQELGYTEDTLLKRRRGEAFNAEQVMAARWILQDSAKELVDLARRIKAGENSDDMLFAFRERTSRHAAIQAQVSGLTAEAGRALQMFRSMAAPGELRVKEIRDVLDATGGRDRAEDLVESILNVVNNASQHPANGGTVPPAVLNAAIKTAAKPNVKDALFELWIMGMLSGPATHAVNVTSNALATAWSVPERAVGALISQSPIGSGQLHFDEVTSQMYGMTSGLVDAIRMAGKAFLAGQGGDAVGKIEAPRASFTAEAFGLDSSGLVGRFVDLIGSWGVRLPGRALGAEDEFFKAVGYRMELHAQAARQGRLEGLTGDALGQRVAELTANPPASLHASAVEAAHYQTFTDPLDRGGRMLGMALNAIPGARVVVPFYKTPINLLSYGLERTPLAPLVSHWRADIAAGGARRDLAMGRMALGSTVMAGTAYLASLGLITGAGPADKDMRTIKKRQGWQPYSIKIGDTYHAYNRLDPLGMTLGIAADCAEIMGQVDERSASELAGAALVSVGQNMMSKTYLKGVSDVVDVIMSAQRYENASKLVDYGTRLIGSAVPSAVATVERVTDPTVRDPSHYKGFEYVLNSIKARVPGYSESLPPRRNLWGEPVVLEGGLGPDWMSPIYTSRDKPSPVDDELLRLRVNIAMPPDQVDGVKLTADEYDRYVVLAGNAAKINGKGLKDAMGELIQSDAYKRQSDGDRSMHLPGGKELLIRKLVSAYRDAAKGQLYREFPDLIDLSQEYRKIKMNAQLPW